MHKIKNFLIPAIGFAAIVGGVVSVYFAANNTNIYTSSTNGPQFPNITQRSELTLQYNDNQRPIFATDATNSSVQSSGATTTSSVESVYIPDSIQESFMSGLKNSNSKNDLMIKIQQDLQTDNPNNLSIQQLRPFLEQYQQILTIQDNIDKHNSQKNQQIIEKNKINADLIFQKNYHLIIDGVLKDLELLTSKQKTLFYVNNITFNEKKSEKELATQQLDNATRLFKENQLKINEAQWVIVEIQNKQIPMLKYTIASGNTKTQSIFVQKLEQAKKDVDHNKKLQESFKNKAQVLDSEKDRLTKIFADKQREFNIENLKHKNIKSKLDVSKQRVEQCQLLKQNVQQKILALNKQITDLEDSINLNKKQITDLKSEENSQQEILQKMFIQPIVPLTQ